MSDQIVEKEKASPTEGRRSSKPIMEKRRRARINSSLAELKALLIDVLKTEGTHHSKMEKADILEMTVKHLRQIQRQQFAVAATVDPSVINKYQVGFNECATEVARYLSSIECLDVELRARVLGHLANCLQMQNIHRNDHSCSPSHATAIKNSMFATRPVDDATAWKNINNQKITFNNNNNVSSAKTNSVIVGSNHNVVAASTPTQAIQLLPSRLPSGEVAFIIPNGIISSAIETSPSYVIPVYASQPTSMTSPVRAASDAQQVPQTTGQQSDTVTNNNCRDAAAYSIKIEPNVLPPNGCVALDMTVKNNRQNDVKIETDDVWRPW